MEIKSLALKASNFLFGTTYNNVFVDYLLEDDIIYYSLFYTTFYINATLCLISFPIIILYFAISTAVICLSLLPNSLKSMCADLFTNVNSGLSNIYSFLSSFFTFSSSTDLVFL